MFAVAEGMLLRFPGLRTIPFSICSRPVVSNSDLGRRNTSCLCLRKLYFSLQSAGFHIAYAQAVPAGFVHVRGADAFQRGTDFFFALGGFGSGIQQTVRGQNEVRLARNHHPFVDGYPHPYKRVDFFFEGDGVDHHAVATRCSFCPRGKCPKEWYAIRV